MPYRTYLATLLLIALGATAMPSLAQEQTPSCVLPVEPAYDGSRASLEQIAGDNRCMQDMHEGMAAVMLLADTGAVFADKAIADGLPGHRWGYIDAQGQLAITPQYEDARPFHQGLAAVRENGLWGYIDKRGQWVLAPQWAQAGDFSAAGIAVVQADGRPLLIDTRGQPVTPPGLGRSIAHIELDHGKPARAIIDYRREYLSPSGVRRYVDGKQRVLARLGDDGDNAENGGPFYIATVDGERQGLLDANWRWAVRPTYDSIEAALPGGMGAARKGNDWYLVDGRTGEIGSQRYEHLESLRDAFWLALPAAEADDSARRNGDYQLLNAKGEVLLASLPERELSNLTFQGNMLAYRTEDTLTLYQPGQTEPLTLPAAGLQTDNYEDYLLLRDENGTLSAIVTPAGAVQKIAPEDPLSQARQFDFQAGRLWLFNAQQTLLNSLDDQGRRLLNDRARETLANSSYRLLTLNVENAPLAILTTGYCQCEEGGAGLLLSDGRAVRHPDWQEVVLLHDDEDLESLPGADALRFAAISENGVVMLDAQGNPLKMEPLQHISHFRHGHALGYAKGIAYLLTPDGERRTLPDYFDVRIVGPDHLAVVMDAAEGSLWGLDGISATQAKVAPQFLEIGEFDGGLAPARSAAGALGLIDGQGQWAVAPEYDEIKRHASGYWILRSKTGNSTFSYEWPSVVASSAGKILTPPLRSLNIEAYDNGYAKAGNSDESWVVGPDGSAFAAGAAQISLIGDWLEVQRDAQAGALDSQGQWVVAPAPVFLSQARDQRLLRRAPEGSELLDAAGKRIARLDDSDWEWLPGSPYLTGRGYDDEREAVTRFADASGKVIATVKGHALGFDGERVLSRAREGGYRWQDKTGKPVGGNHHVLGMLHDGLAGAMGPDGRYAGYVDSQGVYRIAPLYLAVSPFQNGRAVASTAQASYLLDTAGRPLAWVAAECGARILRNAAGKAIWPVDQDLAYCD